MLDVIVDHCRKQIVCRADGVYISRKVQIYILHRHYLSIPAARRAALYSEYRTERRLAQRRDRPLAYAAQPVGKSHRRGGLSLSGGSGSYRGDKYQLSVAASALFRRRGVDLCLISSVRLNIFITYAERSGDLAYRSRLASLCYFNIRQDLHQHHPLLHILILSYHSAAVLSIKKPRLPPSALRYTNIVRNAAVYSVQDRIKHDFLLKNNKNA